jgi:hypothetical protein
MPRPVDWRQVLAFRLRRQHLALACPAASLERAEHVARIYRPAAWVWATVLKGGRAAGIWSSKRAGTTFSVEVEEFSPLARADRAAVEEEVRGMASFLGLKTSLSFTGG